MRRHYGLLDTPTWCNWLVFLPPAISGSRVNLLASCCPTTGTPRLTTTSTLERGTRLCCDYARLPPTLLLPPLAILRTRLLTLLAEKTLREAPLAPLDLSQPAAIASLPSPPISLTSNPSSLPTSFSLPSPTSYTPSQWHLPTLSYPSLSPSPPPYPPSLSPPPSKPKREWRSGRRALPCPTCMLPMLSLLTFTTIVNFLFYKQLL